MHNYNIFCLFVYFFYLTGQNHLEPVLVYTFGLAKSTSLLRGRGRGFKIKLLNCEDICNNNQMKV